MHTKDDVKERDKPKTSVSCIHANGKAEFLENLHPGKTSNNSCFCDLKICLCVGKISKTH